MTGKRKGRDEMKRTLALLMILAILFGLTGCQSSKDSQTYTSDPHETLPPNDNNEGQIEDEKTNIAIPYNAQFIRKGSYQDDADFPNVVLIDSLEELNSYCKTNNINFKDDPDLYNEAFFENHFLVFVALEEGSGSVSHEVYGVEQTADKKLSISIVRNVPEIGTCDMAYWHIILELNKEYAVASTDEILVYLDGDLAWDRGIVEPPKPEARFKEPPKGNLRTYAGDDTLYCGGYNWSYRTKDGIIAAAIADQAGRPLPKKHLTPVVLDGKFAETVYAPIPGSTAYAPTNSLGWIVKLSWESEPTSISYTCWPDRIWQDSNTPEEDVISQENTFYAKPGSYIYEITASWEDADMGYWGTANYYVYIIGGDSGSLSDQNHLTWKSIKIPVDRQLVGDDCLISPQIQLMTFDTYRSTYEYIAAMRESYFKEYGEEMSGFGDVDRFESISYPESFFETQSLATIKMHVHGGLQYFGVSDVRYDEGGLTVVLEQEFTPPGCASNSYFWPCCIFLEIDEPIPASTNIKLEIKNYYSIFDNS